MSYTPYNNNNNRYPPPPPGNGARPDPRHPAYSYPTPPPTSYRSYDPYTPDHMSHQQHPYEQPRPAPSNDTYDPYRPSTSAYDPGRPALQIPPAGHVQYRPPPPRPYGNPGIPRPLSPVRDNLNRFNSGDLALLTPPTSVNVDGHTTVVHALPNSHLPLTKYVPVNRDDAIQLHAHLATRNASIWYAEGSNRAGEGWSAAVEWIYGSGRSGSKMRGCVGEGDALDSEIGGIFKAVEGFHELLRLSLKNATIMPNHLIIFSSSQAAIVGADTSTRPEATKFDSLWREICSELLDAQLTLVWLPHNEAVEGQVLAKKIAEVAASNAYQKRRRENNLPDIYRRPGGGEPAPSGSSQAGNWQRGDTEPTSFKIPFERPAPPIRTSISAEAMPEMAVSASQQSSPPMPLPSAPAGDARPDFAPDEEIPREGSVFVTNFPERATAKDIGILFSQFGSIESVDIYHVSPQHPRLAYVAFVDSSVGTAAIETLHRRPVQLDSAAVNDNPDDFEVWRGWNDTLVVVKAEPPLLIPSSVVGDFADLPDWAKRGSDATTPADQQPESSTERKRDRLSPPHGDLMPNSAPSEAGTSPRKRPRTSADPTSATSVHGSPNGQQISLMAPVTDNGLGLTPSHVEEQVRLGDSADHPGEVPQTSSTAGTNAGPAVNTPRPSSPLLPKMPPTPESIARPAPTTGASHASQGALPSHNDEQGKPALTNSAAEPQENPIKMSAKTLRGLIDLTRDVFPKHEANNWIAHSCLIAFELDQARRALQGDLFATDEAFLTGRDHEQVLFGRGFSPERVDAFIKKVLKVLDGIAAAEDEEPGEDNSLQNITDLQGELDTELSKYPNETKEALVAAGRVMEYLLRGKDLQEKKRLDIERRVKVLEGMVKIGEVVGGVVRFLLTE